MSCFIGRRQAVHAVFGALLLSSLAACGSFDGPGASPNEQLFRASKAGNVATIERAIAAGADVNAIDYSERKNGLRALNYAALYNRPDAVRALVAAGAGIDLANNTGFTALHHAAEAGSVDAARTLLELGADKTQRHRGGLTPLEVAEEAGNADVVAMLR